MTDLTHQPTASTLPDVDVAPSTASDWYEVEAMLHDYLEWLRASTGLEPTVEQPSFGTEIADPRRAYSADDVTMLVARTGPQPIGMVAVQLHADRTAELKRLYVRPFARGRRVADLLVVAAIEDARRLGASGIWLETVQGLMDPAISVYRRHGFRAGDDRSALPLASAIVMSRDVEG
ncbi:MAG: GNAT family N-acetyltransferase [Actinomycetota bacterium]